MCCAHAGNAEFVLRIGVSLGIFVALQRGMSSKRYRPWNPDQMVLSPEAMRDALEQDHIMFRVLDVAESLDISSVRDRMDESDARGTRPFHPRMMLPLLVHAYC
jgi:hypothetical protein